MEFDSRKFEESGARSANRAVLDDVVDMGEQWVFGFTMPPLGSTPQPDALLLLAWPALLGRLT